MPTTPGIQAIQPHIPRPRAIHHLLDVLQQEVSTAEEQAGDHIVRRQVVLVQTPANALDAGLLDGLEDTYASRIGDVKDHVHVRAGLRQRRFLGRDTSSKEPI